MTMVNSGLKGLMHMFFFRVSIKESSVAKLGSVCRRVYRIFSHAYFHHRTLFDEYEVSVFFYTFDLLEGYF